MSGEIELPDANARSVARASARQGFMLTFGGGLIAGGIVGAVLGLALALKSEKAVPMVMIGILMAVPGGWIVGAMFGSIICLPLGLINSAVVAGITWLTYTYDLNVRTYRWILLLCVPSLDMLAIQLVWSSSKTSDLSASIFVLAELVAGIGAIVGSVVQSRWYEQTMALLNQHLELTALGYNPDISAR